MATKPEANAKRAPDAPTKPTKTTEVELKEDDLKNVAGGATGGAGSGKIKFNE